MYLQLFFLAAFVVFFFAQRADALATINSYSQGGREGNELIVYIYGTTPYYSELVLFNLVQYAVLFAPFYLVNLFVGNPVCGGFAIAVAVAMPINSYLGVREWRKWEKS